tara:strand:+ start:7081 stop:8616 length:1536 start_codon:yes stop_codon:yes gene_type:complete
MAITIDINYSNSFYLKRIYGTGSNTTDAVPPGYAENGQIPLAYEQGSGRDGGMTLDPNTGITNFPTWETPIIANTTYDWYIEESRIRGGYNNTSVDFGVKAYIVEENDSQQRLSNSLIYSGIFNSRTGINQTNQFSVADEITRSVDPINGSIQKLFAEDTNLTVFQERKVNIALIDKDAIYSAEGGGTVTTVNQVIGAITPVPGNWGIGLNPESFATYGYTKYFVDKDRAAVLKIEGNQIQEISLSGMTDFFRDQLGSIGTQGAILGSYDIYNKNYVISLQPNGRYITSATPKTYKTLSWDERNQGWTSFYTYGPDDSFSVKGKYYSCSPEFATSTQMNASSYLWEHYSNTDRNNFYGLKTPSSIKFVFNPQPNFIKTFKTINYEGSNGWEVTEFISDSTGQDLYSGNWEYTFDTATQPQSGQYNRIYSYDEGVYVEDNIQYRAGFDRKQNKYYAVIPNNTPNPAAGEVIYGNSMMGIKGYFATVTMKTDNTTNNGGPKALFAVSTELIMK